MGKVEEENQLPISSVGANSTDQNVENRCGRFSGWVKFRCVLALLFGGAVLLSAVFLLPIFHNGDLGDLDLDPKFRGTPYLDFVFPIVIIVCYKGLRGGELNPLQVR